MLCFEMDGLKNVFKKRSFVFSESGFFSYVGGRRSAGGGVVGGA